MYDIQLHHFSDEMNLLETALDHGVAVEEIRDRLTELTSKYAKYIDNGIKTTPLTNIIKDEFLEQPALSLFFQIAEKTHLSYEEKKPLLITFAKNYLARRESKDLEKCIYDVKEKLGLKKSDIGQIIIDRYDNSHDH